MGEPPNDLPYRTITFPVNFFRDSIKARDANGDPIQIADVVETRVGCDPATLDTVAIRDSTARFMVVYGNPLRGPDTVSLCVTRCDSIFDALQGAGKLSPYAMQAGTIPVDSDFFFDIYTTNEVPLTFLRSRINSHLLTIVERGGLDTMIRRIVDGVLTDTTWDNALSRVMAQFSLNDEPREGSYWFYKTLSSKVQRFIRQRDSTRNSTIFSNPFWDFNTFRAFGGDYDSLSHKMIGTWMEHRYPIEGWIPIYYANPDSMYGGRSNGWYGDIIADNDTLVDYPNYTLNVQQKLALKKTSVCEAIDVARFRYLHLAPPHPVMTNVQVGGWLKYFYETGYGPGYVPGFRDNRRPTTPEEIIAQSWFMLNCGSNGIMYSDMIFDGNHFGVMHHTSGEHSRNYDTLQTPIPFLPFTDTLFRIPKMWIGMQQRFTAIREVTNEIRRIDTIYSKLIYNREQLTVNDTTESFSLVPLVDSLYTIRAFRYVPPDSTGSFSGSTPDPRSQTYMEITQYTPGPTDSNRAAAGVRYLLTTNLRTWPLDTTTSDGVQGLGAIDARKVVVSLNNVSGIVADSFIVEWVGHESEWSQKGAFNVPKSLRWLKPGWGALYRIIPIPSGISPLGTAYNNGVRAENPSTDSTERDRFIVYERDSVIYLRAIDSLGTISPRFRLGMAADTILDGMGRRRSNFRPVIASSRNGTAALAVWEQLDRDGKFRVVATRLDGLPTTAGLPSTSFFSLIPFTTLPAGVNYHPVVTGVDSGWVVAWGTSTGTHLVAIRDKDNINSSNDISLVDTARAVTADFGLSGTVTMSQLTQYPTLAYRPMRRFLSGVDTVNRQWAHLAYQQMQTGSSLWSIFYNQIVVGFTGGARPTITVMPVEHVSVAVPGCSFIHPSIAVDSVRIGVAFERDHSDTTQQVILKFRDTISQRVFFNRGYWYTPAYAWGTVRENFERPSLTQFPRADSISLVTQPEGGLAWHWTNSPDNIDNRQFLYRYGWHRPEPIAHGQHPSMMLAPYRRDQPLFSSTGILHRRDDATGVLGARAGGGQAYYYPAGLINNPTDPVTAFTRETDTAAVVALAVYRLRFGGGPCVAPVKPPFHHGIVTDRPRPNGDTIGIPNKPGPTPVFFGAPNDYLIVDSSDVIAHVTRTGVFRADTVPVTIRRRIGGTDALITWLDGLPFDSVLGRPADIMVVTELVRETDGAILWRGDTVTARDVDADTLEEVVVVPVHEATGAGTLVHIRLRPVFTDDVAEECEVMGMFHFAQWDTDEGRFAKTLRRREGPGTRMVESSSLTAEIVPNPAGEEAELRLHVPGPTALRITIHNSYGTAVASLPVSNVARSGEYSSPLDLSELPSGIYLVAIESGFGMKSISLVVAHGR